MRGAYQIPQGDWTSRDSLAEVTEIYLRPEEMETAAVEPSVQLSDSIEMPVIPRRFTPPQHFTPQPQQARYEMPSLAVYATGSSPSVRISERLDATHRVTRQAVATKFPIWAIGIVGAIAVGVLVGIVVAFSGGTTVAAASTPAPVAVTKPVVTPIVVAAPAPPVVVAPAPVVPALVSIRIDSQPSGGIATLIDGPKATQLGATPLAVSLDPKRSYDIMVSLEGHAPRVMHVTPTAGADVLLNLDDASSAPPVVAPRHVEKTSPVVAEKGTLRISSKPPCAITIDGKPSGKTTPQAALALSVGTHEVTLTNEEQGINLTTEVEIRADKPTAVVQDFTK